jgi:hypothetical protein
VEVLGERGMDEGWGENGWAAGRKAVSVEGKWKGDLEFGISRFRLSNDHELCMIWDQQC